MLAVEVEKKLGEFSLTSQFASETGATACSDRRAPARPRVINMIAGLLRAGPRPHRARRRGAVRRTQRASTCRPWRRRIGYVFQEGRLFPHLTRAAQSRLWPLDGRPRRRSGGVRARGRVARHRPSARPPARQTVGRRAPARRGRPRAADAPAPAAARRAARLARRGAQGRHPAVPGTAARRGAGADDLCQPRRGGSETHRQPRGAAGRRQGVGNRRRGVAIRRDARSICWLRCSLPSESSA